MTVSDLDYVKVVHMGRRMKIQRSSKVVDNSLTKTRMLANAQRDGRPAEHRWRPLFNAANFG